MLNQRLREADRVRRLAATQCERWYVVGREVLDENSTLICEADTPWRAEYIVALHNNILSICAGFFHLAAKHADRLTMTKEQNDPRGKD